MDQAVQDGVGHGGVVDDPVPFVHGKLAGDERGALARAGRRGSPAGRDIVCR